MSRELMIIFVYDTNLVKHECDDPASAIIYFCPSWIPDETKVTICGQIIGTFQFLKSVFGSPQIVSLQNGKFWMKESGKYIMAVGIDHDVSDWVLKNKTGFLSNLISLFRCDFEFMSTFYKDNQTFIEKLNQMFESYMKILNLNCNMYKLPSLQLSRVLNNIASEAHIFLTSCRNVKFVLGGLILWNGKVLATQLNSLLTKCIALTSPIQNKVFAESVMTDFQLPKDVHLLHIYLTNEDYEEISEATYYHRNLQYYDDTQESSVQKSYNLVPNKQEICLENNAPAEILQQNEAKINRGQVDKNFINSPPTCDMSYVLFENGLIKRTSSLINMRPSNSTMITSKDKMSTKSHHRIKTNSICDPLYPFVNSKGVSVSKQIYQQHLSINKRHEKNKSSEENVCLAEKEGNKSGSSEYYSLESNGLEVSGNDFCVHLCPEDYKSFEEGKIYTSTNPITTDTLSSISQVNVKNNEGNCDDEKLPEKSNAPDEVACESIPSDQLPKVDDEISGNKMDNNELPRSYTKTASDEPVGSSVAFGQNQKKHDKDMNETKLESHIPQSENEENSTKACEITIDEDSTSKMNKSFRFGNSEYKECILFILYYNNLIVNFILEDEVSRISETVNILYDKSVEFLENLSKQSENPFEDDAVESQASSSASHDFHSFLFTNKNWEHTEEGGCKENLDLNTVTRMHNDLMENREYTDLIVRTQENVIYGHQNDDKVVYYQLRDVSSTGAPSPTDCIANIFSKARRRLSRTSRSSSLNLM